MDVVFEGPGGAEVLPARLRVGELALGAVAEAGRAAAELAAARTGGGPAPRVTVDSRAVAASFAGDKVLRIDGEPQPMWSPLSGFWRTADGWVRTHANYPHHRARLLSALGGVDDDRDALAETLAQRRAEDVEREVMAAGGLAVAVRTPEAWAEHPQGRAAARLPLVGVVRGRQAGGAPVLPPLPRDGGVLLPAAGLRVLDLTRVIAGPVATRTLALLGADVLRVDDPNLPELPAQHLDTGTGKRSALLDLRSPGGRAAFARLLDGADVLVTGYRPGALAGVDPDLAPEALGARRPGLIEASLSAWGPAGPWRGGRGFDSLVQAASGIAVLEEPADESAPGALPVQALDHATGYLLAAAVLRAAAERCRAGAGAGGVRIEAALARTADELMSRSADREDAGGRFDAAALPFVEERTEAGLVRHAPPAFRLDGGPEGWAHPSRPWGRDAAEWLPR